MTIAKDIDIQIKSENESNQQMNVLIEEALRLINLLVNKLAPDGTTALDAVDKNQNASEELKNEMRSMLRKHNALTGDEVREIKQILRLE
tara:strand:- start:1275 stop:1544 length:270 start_codon:yes stop_codon:yes gene_type:complete